MGNKEGKPARDDGGSGTAGSSPGAADGSSTATAPAGSGKASKSSNKSSSSGGDGGGDGGTAVTALPGLMADGASGESKTEEEGKGKKKKKSIQFAGQVEERFEPKYEHFRTYEGYTYLVYLKEDGSRIYEGDDGEWHEFYDEWFQLGDLVDADEEEDGEQRFITWVHPDGTSYDTFMQDGKRFYADFEQGDWVEFPAEWEGTGAFQPSVSENEEGGEQEFSTFQTPDGRVVTTYEVDEMVSVTYYYEDASDSWVKLPDSWKHSRPMTASRMGESSANLLGTSGNLNSTSGASSKEVERLKRSNSKYKDEIAKLQKKVEDLVAQGQRNIERAKKKIKGVEDKLGDEINRLRSENETMQTSTAIGGSAQKEKIAKLEAEIQKLRFSGGEEMKASLAEKDETISKLEDELQESRKALASAKIQKDSAMSGLKSRLQRLSSEVLALKPIFVELKTESVALRRSVEPDFENAIQAIIARADASSGEVDELRAKYRAEMLQRKLLFNKIQEMRGNIRVFCRVRGLNDREKGEGGLIAVSFDAENEVSIKDEKGSKKTFEFDRVFPPGSTQEQVFEDTAPLVTSCVDGYNVCLFAYGQTGAGKTYTMMGPPDNRGVNLRALNELFRLTREKNDEWDFLIVVSYLEIYNEQIKDLLVKKGQEIKLDVRQGPQGNFVPDLTEVNVKSLEDVENLINTGDKARTMASTAMNASSSRSHSCLQVRVTGTNRETKTQSHGKLTLVDLAGSERISKSEATGQRLVEAAAINKSLSALGNVISGLQGSQSHVPYRDSKLTFLLQDSLGGDSKTMMFLNLSPATFNAEESINSLKFGSRVRNVTLGQATKNTGGPGKGKGKGKGKRPPPGGR